MKLFTNVLLLALVASACNVGSTFTTSTRDGMDAMAKMGDPTATAAEDVPDAELREATFVLLDTRPTGYDGASGTAALAFHDAGTTVTLRMAGLVAGVAYISHLHMGTCAESGGDHFMFDLDGPAMPPNEIHLAFTADAAGTGFMTVENDRVATGARSVVVHPAADLDAKLACAEF